MFPLRQFLDPREQTIGLRHWWQLHALLGTLIALILGIALTLSGVVVARHFHPEGGMKPPAQPPQTTVISGAFPPAQFSLQRFEIRQHNQGSSNSCVWQTVSQIVEVWNREYGITLSISGGYGWNRVEGYNNVGMTYQDAAAVATNEGAAPLRVYANDGTYAQAAGPIYSSSRFRARSAVYLAPGDRLSIERVIAAGTPAAVAIPWYSSLTYKTDCSIVTAQSGYFSFWHSTVADAYNQDGIHIRNSWPGWGCNNGAWLSWGFLASVQPNGAYPIVMALSPAAPIHHSFPATRWNAYRLGHHRSLIPYKRHGRLIVAARVYQSHATRLRGVKGKRWYGPAPDRADGYYKWSFAGGHGRAAIYVWPRLHHATKITFGRSP